MAKFHTGSDLSADAILIEQSDVHTVAVMATELYKAGSILDYARAAESATRLYAETQLAIVTHNRGRLAGGH